jgi:Zn-dependent peptidase ImmA (M78 family)
MFRRLKRGWRALNLPFMGRFLQGFLPKMTVSAGFASRIGWVMRVSERKNDRPHYNPAMLRWARDLAGVSIEQAAKRGGVSPEHVAVWEGQGSEKPTVRQARALADLYGVSFLEFFRSEPPDLPQPEDIPDFRLFASAADPSEDQELKNIQLWAEAQRVNALDLFDTVGERPPMIDESLFATIDQSSEKAAASIRYAIRYPVEDQVGRTQTERAKIPGELRRKIEALGILTLRRTDLKHLRVRGFCIWARPLPIVVIGSDAPTAQSFTLAHEIAHVFLRQSAISGTLPRRGGDPSKRRVEEWCNSFASSFLMPRDAVLKFRTPPPAPLASFPDDDLRAFANYFGVSEHAMLIRLVHLRYVSESYYWEVKKPFFDAQEANAKSFGRSKYYGVRFRGNQGDLYTGLVLEAWATGRITGHHAAEYMGIKNLQHMFDIRENYGGG